MNDPAQPIDRTERITHVRISGSHNSKKTRIERRASRNRSC